MGKSRKARSAGADAKKDGRHTAEVEKFPVIALGASAGGLTALEHFLKAVPTDSGAAYVVIQHLAPTQTSRLTELLGQEARISVVEATEGCLLEPNHAYVIPPGRYIAIADGALHLTEMDSGYRLPIDFFLRSLAVERQDRAAAVILSGTGSDGTLGVQAVKGEGGIVAVQSPESAEYPGMPESAIATGQADFVLPPEDLSVALLGYFQHPLVPAGKSEPAERNRELMSILALLRDRKGHDFSLYKHSTLIRRIRRRMAIHGLERYGDYLRWVRERPEELDKLFRELLIQVSGFFRDAEAFRTLEDSVIPRLFEGRQRDEPVRIWVPGCSSGEEAYSIAILLQEYMDSVGESWPVQIFATDIDERALNIGRSGRFPASITADVSPQRLRQFFGRRGESFEVVKALRQMLIFAEQDLIKDPPFSRLDLISCRNVLIYMGPELQKRVLSLFHYALNPGGFLFLGTSETIGNADELFETVNRGAKLYRCRTGTAGRMAFPGGGSLFPQPPAAMLTPTALAAARRETTDIGALAQRAVLQEYAAPFIVVDGDNQIQYFHGRTGKFLEPPSGAPSVNVIQMCREPLRPRMRSILHSARAERRAVRGSAVQIDGAGGEELVRLTARPLSTPGGPEGLILVLLEELGPLADQEHIEVAQLNEGDSERVTFLEQELAYTKEALQATIEELETSNEELKSSNEELQSSNEELQSSNEELETSREELQSVNEELHTVNAELESEVEALSRASDDMNNLLASTDLGIIFLDPHLRVERFTPAATRIVPLIESDIGRPFNHLAHGLGYQRLEQDIRQVMDTLAQLERRVEDQNGNAYVLRIRPYRTSDGRVSGAVLAFVDVADPA
ncbi:PAS domain-containing protein [Ectothiorhodospiraceae bacterium WFHF3C12]|nr:PAS domain-containing protein [Ectothiorhodospiraceae bacterium WFHF3C12]